MDFAVNIENYKPLRDIVFDALRESIITGRLAPGERLMEIQLAEDMGVSRTPVREAIRKLELEGFVAIIPRKGTYVAGLSMKQITEVFEVRAALEGFAASLAAERISDDELHELERLCKSMSHRSEDDALEEIVSLDEAFHDIIFTASRNAKLSQIIGNLREQIHRYRVASLNYPGRLILTSQEHQNIVDALVRKDQEAAREAVCEHVKGAEESFIKSMMETKYKGK